MQTASSHWTNISQNWPKVTPPLRPSQCDLDCIEQEISSMTQLGQGLRALILGVTPELHDLSWPKNSQVSAIDRNQAMIDYVWPKSAFQAIKGDWRALPVADQSIDMVLCDGGLHLQSYREGQAQLVSSIHRALRPRGRVILRLFAPRQQRKGLDIVFQDLTEGRIESLSILKVLLGMAIQVNPEAGVTLHHIWRHVKERFTNADELALQLGCQVEEVLSLESYKNCQDRYCFVTREQVVDLFCRDPGGFIHLRTHIPSYQNGELFPSVVFERQ